MAETIIGDTKKEGLRKAKDEQPIRTKKKRELISLVVGSYLTNGPLMSSTCKWCDPMQSSSL
jgi:hypothetical protein